MNKRISYATCLLLGTLIGVIIGQIAVGIAIGMFIYCVSPSKKDDDKQG